MQIGDEYLRRVNWNISARDVLDPSVLSLLASNAVLIIWAVVQHWPLPFVVCVYWAQSVIIGLFWFFTILTYGNIRLTYGVDGYEEHSAAKPTNRAGVACAFALHYGAFHAFFFFWMLRGLLIPMMDRMSGDSAAEIALPDLPLRALLIFAGIFFVGRLFEFLREQTELAEKQANAAKLTFFPYARIIPMHVVTFIGASLDEGKSAPQEQPPVEQVRCRCPHTDFIESQSAAKYADGHLNWLETAQDGLTARYICPETRKTWVMVAGALKAEHPKSDEALCRCAHIDHLDGPQAQRYAKEHLKPVETDGGWRTTYICPYTDKRWLLDYTKIADRDQAKYARLRPLPPKTAQH